MTVSAEAARLALALAFATPMTGCLQARQDRPDFGGKCPHLLKVRRIRRNDPCGDVRDGDFGIYLGRHDGGYFVALQAIFPPDLIGCERFPTLAELKANWELD